MKTIILNKSTNPRTRIGLNKETTNLHNGVDINGGPSRGGSIKWAKEPIK